MAVPTLALLLVDPQGDALVDDLRKDVPQLNVTVAASVTAARAYLGASAFDVVVVSATMPEDAAPSLEALVASLKRTARVLPDAPPDDVAGWLRDHLALDPTSSSAPSGAEYQEVLKAVSAELARIAHALNNPLAVIDGNAQLALELSRALGVDASVISAIEDIQGGSQSLAELFADLTTLRKRVDGLTG